MDAVAVLFVGMFVFTLGEVVTVLGSNPYNSRRVPASHRGRVGGVSSVLHSIFSSATQYLISFMLIWTGSNYKLLWMIFIGCGLVGAVLYGVGSRLPWFHSIFHIFVVLGSLGQFLAIYGYVL